MFERLYNRLLLTKRKFDISVISHVTGYSTDVAKSALESGENITASTPKRNDDNTKVIQEQSQEDAESKQ